MQARTAIDPDSDDDDDDDRHQLHVEDRCALSGIATSASPSLLLLLLNVAIRSPGAKALEARRRRPRDLEGVPDKVRVEGMVGIFMALFVLYGCASYRAW